MLNALQSLLEDEQGFLYNPDAADPIKAYYIAVRANPTATDGKILQLINKHIPANFYTVLQNTIDSNATVESSNSTLKKKLHEWVTRSKRDSLNFASPTASKPQKSADEIIAPAALFRELIDEVRRSNKPPSAAEPRETMTVNAVQQQQHPQQQQPQNSKQHLCEFHLDFKSKSYTCRPSCSLFDSAVFTIPTRDGAFRKPREDRDRRRAPYQRPDNKPNNRYENRSRRQENQYETPQRESSNSQRANSLGNPAEFFDYEKFGRAMLQLQSKN